MNKKLLMPMLALFLFVGTASAQNDAHRWANFKRYAAQNEKLLEQNAPKERQVVFMGNSITEGWARTRPEFFKNNGYVGRGISGQTSYQFLLRFRQDVVALAPRVVVINAATNDIAENTGAYNEDYTFGNICSMAEIAKANGIKVILTSTLPAASYHWRKSVTDVPQKITSLNDRIAAYAKKHKIPYVDYYSHLVREEDKALDPQFTKDGVHPTAVGYAVMEELIQPVVQKQLKKRR